MENEKIDPVMGDTVESAPKGKKEKLRARLHDLRRNWPQIAILTRYLLPVLGLLVLFVMGWFYNVRTVSVGVYARLSLWRLYGNTLSGTHTYLGGKIEMTKSWFYGLLSVGAIIGMLIFLLAAFLTVLAAVTAVRAFRAGHESEESNRMKMIFKIAFPNRVCLFLSDLLLLVPALFPHFVAFVGSRFLAVGGEEIIFVRTNPVLITVGALLLLTLVLACIIPRLERQRRMNMFLLYHAPTPDSEGEDGEE